MNKPRRSKAWKRQHNPGDPIKAIETSYRGYRFRSRLEARWAVFFTQLGVDWRYEEQGYELPIEGKYLPDFWIPNLFGVGNGAYVEIKGQKPTVEEVNKCFELAQMTEEFVILLFGNIGAPVIKMEKTFVSPSDIPLPEDAMLDADSDKFEIVLPRIVDGAIGLSIAPPRHKVMPDGNGGLMPNPETRNVFIPELRCFQDDINGSMDIWPLYLEPTPLKSQTYTMHNWSMMLSWETSYDYVPLMKVYVGQGRTPYSERLQTAYNIARAARFEHGEMPH